MMCSVCILVPETLAWHGARLAHEGGVQNDLHVRVLDRFLMMPMHICTFGCTIAKRRAHVYTHVILQNYI